MALLGYLQVWASKAVRFLMINLGTRSAYPSGSCEKRTEVETLFPGQSFMSFVVKEMHNVCYSALKYSSCTTSPFSFQMRRMI